MISASQIVLCAAQENGPEPNQVSRGVLVEAQELPKKAIFLVFDSGIEEEWLTTKVLY